VVRRVARIPFVAGLDSYMPSWLGKIHPRYATPYAALIVHASVSLILVIANFLATGGVQESFQRLLSLAVVLQLIPFLYIFGALLKIAVDAKFVRGHYGKGTLIFAASAGSSQPFSALPWPISRRSRSLRCSRMKSG